MPDWTGLGCLVLSICGEAFGGDNALGSQKDVSDSVAALYEIPPCIIHGAHLRRATEAALAIGVLQADSTRSCQFTALRHPECVVRSASSARRESPGLAIPSCYHRSW